MNENSEVIILKNSDYRDADAILNVLSLEYGKMSFVARGIRKPKSKNANACNLFNISRFHYNYQEQRTMQSLKVAESLLNFHKIREDLLKQSIAGVMVEMIDKVDIDDVEHAYHLLKQSLLYLEKTDNILCLFGLFVANVCTMCGITPYVDGCVHCKRTNDLASISLIDGGFVCVNCIDSAIHVKKERSTLKFFRLFNKAKIEQFDLLEDITPCNYQDIEDLLLFFNEYSGIHLKSLKFLKHLVELENG
ncbi:DNA repair protein RecO (recombination protein O) [Breznakia sp. PF5-3]|uniref:DNA repair protein RecO n=1 Tax=unclassified Breznakia TaxID=2623764 RepID=UPI002405FE1E|nr:MULTISPECIES: DNA repair protein RecO [unclassified Breznakia]MDF9824430.1 DNA repair protein RecO (recombination protein O) [Breznakia sp. PM6-1]MDF9835159.1 DNA repair protein RecO (recombination protein O) [Breznakia sp. PF5-3]MDL2276122.1 DNA repair protein RecO [Breznakia sp. OttesenSCG-928-G09]